MPDIKEIESELGIDTKAAIIEPVQHPDLAEHKIHLHIKRDDLLHPIISGNKWRKLKYSLLHALNKEHQHLISMGGRLFKSSTCPRLCRTQTKTENHRPNPRRTTQKRQPDFIRPATMGNGIRICQSRCISRT